MMQNTTFLGLIMESKGKSKKIRMIFCRWWSKKTRTLMAVISVWGGVQDVVALLACGKIDSKTTTKRASILRWTNSYVWWKGRLFCWWMKQLVDMVSQGERKCVMHSMLDELEYWDLRFTLKLVSDWFWWPGVLKGVAHYLKPCNSCQRMGSPRP